MPVEVASCRCLAFPSPKTLELLTSWCEVRPADAPSASVMNNVANHGYRSLGGIRLDRTGQGDLAVDVQLGEHIGYGERRPNAQDLVTRERAPLQRGFDCLFNLALGSDAEAFEEL